MHCHPGLGLFYRDFEPSILCLLLACLGMALVFVPIMLGRLIMRDW